MPPTMAAAKVACILWIQRNSPICMYITHLSNFMLHSCSWIQLFITYSLRVNYRWWCICCILDKLFSENWWRFWYFKWCIYMYIQYLCSDCWLSLTNTMKFLLRDFLHWGHKNFVAVMKCLRILFSIKLLRNWGKHQLK